MRGGFFDLFFCGVGNTECDIVVEGIVEKNGFLIDVSHHRPQVEYFHVFDIDAVDVYPSLVYIIETG